MTQCRPTSPHSSPAERSVAPAMLPPYTPVTPTAGDPMSKREDQRLAALAKKNAAKVVPPKADRAARVDPTLRHRPEEDAETRRLFKEMKRREF